MGRPIVDLTGQRFGLLLVISQIPRTGPSSVTYWNCLCECGTACRIRSGDLRKRGFARKRGVLKPKNGTQSCGCLNRKMASERLRQHGMSLRPIYKVWSSMKSRCHSPGNRAYFQYGGRGIFVCPEWIESFEVFYRDMGGSYRRGLTLDRRDNDKGYSKANCRWVTRKVQNNNRRDNIWVETPVGRITLHNAAKQMGVARATLRDRVRKGWPNDKLFLPPDSGRKVIV